MLLRKLRTDAGLTQEKLAEVAKISYRSVSDLERGINRSPRRDTARLLADALGLSGPDRAAFEAAASGRGPAERGYTATPQPGGMAAATRTLPRDISSFTGRHAEIESLLQTVTGTATAGSVVDICAIGGMAGVGKTALAVHAAHRLADRFPDGQIFLPLHGHAPGQRPVGPADALASLLQTIGVAVELIPDGLEARTRLWRDRVAGRRMLLLLDDAAEHEQVRPLLPGTAGSLVLITSRNRLTALEDTQAISLDVLSAGEAAEMLIRLSTRSGLSATDQPVRDIIELCGYLPLAVAMLGRQLHHHTTWTVTRLSDDLATARDRLELMHTENLSVAAAFDLSYNELSAEQQRLFRRLGLFPGTDIDAYAAAALSGTGLGASRRNLEGLSDRYLLAESVQGRYHMHDLLAEHARALSAADPAVECDAAVGRLLDYYLHTARTADRYLARHAPAGTRTATVPPPAGTPELRTRDAAVIWMETERVNLHAAARYAASHDRPCYATAIPAAMHGFLRGQGYWNEALALDQTALDAARQMGDSLAQAGALTDLGTLQLVTGDYAASAASHERALKLYRDLGNTLGEANSRNHLGNAQQAAGEHEAAAANHERALRLHQELGNTLGEANSYNNLGGVYLANGDHPTAAVNYERSLRLFRELDNPGGEAQVLNSMGELMRATKAPAEAIAYFERALVIAARIGSLPEEARAREGIGRCYLHAGDSTLGGAYLRNAREIYRKISSPRAKQC